jgi:DNA mismatch repair ATPase MutS
MKSLQEFKQEPSLVEEEKSDYSKFDMLVRAGLANKAQLARIHRILDKMQEDRPVFNNADRMILQNLFNKMVDVISNNKQIFQQTRRAVREEVEEEIQVNEIQLTEEQMKGDPPFVLVLKRKAIRLYPNKTKIALYHNEKLGKYFSIPYSTEKDIDAPIQSEQVEITEGKEVMDHIHDIVKEKQARKVKFANGKHAMIDGYTASAIKQVHDSVNDENKSKLRKMVHSSPEGLHKVASFAFSKVK